MAFTVTQIETLEKAIATGTKKVKYGDKETEYQSTDEMMRVLDMMKADVYGTPTLSRRRKMGIYKSTNNRC